MKTFESLEIHPDLKRAISELGFENPTPIQEKTFPILLGAPTDFLGLAATGTGKTAAFSIPLLSRLSQDKKGVQALILCPTRELAKQITEQINLLARYRKTKALAVYGGSDFGGQLRALKDGVAIVVGTPGRILDHLERGSLKITNVETVILDEADEMISMGFKEEIETILEQISSIEKHKTWLFSATMSPEIRKIADHFLTSPKKVQVESGSQTAASVSHFFYSTYEDEKAALLQSIIDLEDEFYGLVFCQTKMMVNDVTDTLKRSGYLVDCLHGDMTQNEREKTLRLFKAKALNLLVCTDVASRGIDVKDLTHVINYSIPREFDLYVHRIGRTGRGGKTGIALSLVSPSQMGLLRNLERVIRAPIKKANPPSPAQVLLAKIKKELHQFKSTEQNLSKFPELLEGIKKSEWMALLESETKESIVARFLSLNIKPTLKRAPPPAEKQNRNKKPFKRREFQGKRQHKGGKRASFIS